ncbi:zinc ABC transporter substrate-binding protein AztC [Mycobacterium sp. GA-2829]|uniref:zinc ABC transporter substrate-binding protein AztC n=1 Tax=Mycobacterium sp. GA-2829 TaxID=1772283 RepID=UPI00073FDC3A|nr:zinc ABC transporter substrate-binding protein AztC [Mycobacterium sp. GA-2829]KUI36730.1 ABC transporter substrate-binding protein [Mycobacterium sp. GA-2829]
MTRRCLAWLLVLVASALTACGATRSSGEIIVTTNIIGDVVRNVVGDAATVRVLMQPNADPHSFALSARDAAALSAASLIVSNGLGLEEGVARHVLAAADDGVPTLAVGDRVDPLRYRQGESVGTPDPHFWMDPRRMIAAVDAVEETVNREVDRIDTAAVARNAERYREELRTLDAWMSRHFSGIRPERRKLVTNHHVLGYLADRFQFEVVGAIVPSGTTLAAPSSSDLQSLVSAIRSAGAPAVFVDSSQPERLARVLAEQAGVQVRIVALYTESLSAPGTPGATYLDMMRADTDAIVNGLR